MSKIRADKIEYQEDKFLVKVIEANSPVPEKKDDEELLAQEILMKNRAQVLIDEANSSAQEIVEKAQKEAEEIISNAKKQAEEILNNAQLESENKTQEMVSSAQEEIEKERIEQAKIGYEEGHKDGQEKIQEELEEKIKEVDNFCSNQFELKNKILKSIKNDIFGIISNISRKVLQKELNAQVLEKIIKKTIALLEKKENINVILSEKYARMFLELQNKKLGEEQILTLDELKNYENFNISCNPKISDDTIIVENLKERFDASINSQLDIIINEVYKSIKDVDLDLISEEVKNEIE